MSRVHFSGADVGESFLLFRSLNELYGTPLHSVREVVPFRKPRMVPKTHRNFLGIVNLRGEIVGVIDMRIFFSSEGSVHLREAPHALVVVNSSAGCIGVAVDQIEGVWQLSTTAVAPNTRAGIDSTGKGVIGIGRFKQGLATLLELKTLCGSLSVAIEDSLRMID